MAYPEIPNSLRIWFLIHFAIDILFALILIFFTADFLQYIDLPTENLLLARLVGAALIGIGGVSLLYKNSSREIYRVLLNLKLLWSGAAMIAIIITLFESDNIFIWLSLGVFLLFFIVWQYFKLRI